MRLILTSVGYADFLEQTLGAWLRVVPPGALSIATSPDDRATQRLADVSGVPVIQTDAWTSRDPSCHVGTQPVGFNMGYGLDVALGLAGDLVNPPQPGELCGHVNPDCYPSGQWPADDTFEDDKVYGFWRYACPTPADLWAYVDGARGLDSYPRMKNAKHGPIGYCQMFRYRPGVRFGSYPTAGGFDTDFNRQFASRVMRDEVTLLHLGDRDKRNWAGRVLPAWGAA